MSFVSLEFPAFVGLCLLVYAIVPQKWRWCVLLAASYGFYLVGGLPSVAVLLFTTLTTWLAGLLLGRLNEKKQKKYKKLLVAVTLLLNFGLLYCIKYLDFTLSAIGVQGVRFEWILPLGLSFYMFQSVGYVIDCYRGKGEVQKNPLKYALFTSFFPQMIQGPISRYRDLSPQLLAGKPLQADDLRDGLQLILWGYLKKMVLADRAAVFVTGFFANADAYGGAVTAFTILMYCLNLYCDFSGGIDITRGVAQLFGITLAENFRRPIFATSLTDYWRRWHITLGSWMRDYVFYPLSFSRPFAKLNKWARKKFGGKPGKIVATSAATFLVYLLIGLWHGANFRYIAFGFWNGSLITASLLLNNVFHRLRTRFHIRKESKPWKLFSMARTAFLVFLGRYITRASRLLTAFSLMARTFRPSTVHLHELWSGVLLQMGLAWKDFAVLGAGTAVLLLVETYQEYRGSVRLALSKKNALVQWLAIVLPLLALVLLGIYRGSYIASEFIYRQY